MSLTMKRLVEIVQGLADEETALQALRASARRDMAWYFHQVCFCDRASCAWCTECPGHGRGGTRAPCCCRAGEHDGSGGGEYLPDFVCPVGCPCHD